MLVLSDSAVHAHLDQLGQHELEAYQQVLVEALHAVKAHPEVMPPRTVYLDPRGTTNLFMPAFGGFLGLKALTASKAGFLGATLCFDPNSGLLVGVINAYTLTAFRTALATLLALVKSQPDASGPGDVLTVFGSGPQAYWHVVVAVRLYPGRFGEVVVANRSRENAEALAKRVEKAVGVAARVVLYQDEAAVSAAVRSLSVVFGCTPSCEPVIRGAWVDWSGPVFVGLIGSYKPHMQEVDAEFVATYTASHAVVVDSAEHAILEAGELIMNKVQQSQLVEVGELWSMGRLVAGQPVVWCKMVGTAIMDMAVGRRVLEDAAAGGWGKAVDL